MNLRELNDWVASIDPHTCGADELRAAQAAVVAWARDDGRTLSDRAAAGALTRRLTECARARVQDPVPLHAIEARMR